jgi:hypothetical protein
MLAAALEAPPVAADQPTGAHQPSDALAACPHPMVVAELGVDAWGAVGAAGVAVDPGDLLQELLIGLLAGGGATITPGAAGWRERRPRRGSFAATTAPS